MDADDVNAVLLGFIRVIMIMDLMSGNRFFTVKLCKNNLGVIYWRFQGGRSFGDQ